MDDSAKLKQLISPPAPGHAVLAPAPRRDQAAVLATVVDRLCAAGNGQLAATFRGQGRAALPSRDAAVQIVEGLRSVLFPGYFGRSELSSASLRYHVGSTLDRLIRTLQDQIRRGLCFDCDGEDPQHCAACDARSLETAHAFLERLPAVKRLLDTDVRAAYEGDPAATSPDETIFCYPGIQAITSYRIAHELYRLGVPLIPRIITEHAHSETGIDIHPGARIGETFFIDHGTGIVIGETCRIGDRVRVYQGVTLGAKSLPLDEQGNPIKGIERHPIVEDDVVIYSGATILGPVTIGAGSVIGGNVWLTRSVPPGSRITQAQVRQDLFRDGGGI
jgi:serine O-acetyltransferase